jgi:hypothetical protein
MKKRKKGNEKKGKKEEKGGNGRNKTISFFSHQ